MLGIARRKHSLIALDAGPASVALCQLERSGAALRFQDGAAIEDPLRDRPEEDQLAAPSVERATRLLRQARFRGRAAAVALKPPEVAFHTFAVPAAMRAAARGELLPPLKLEASRQMQVEPDQIEIDFWNLPAGNRAGDNVMIAATRRSAVESWEQFCEAIGLHLTEVDVLPLALLRAARAPGATEAGADALWGVLDVGFGGALLALAVGSCCVYVRQLTLGGDALTRAISDALEVDYKTAEMLKRQVSDAPANDAGPNAADGALRDVRDVVQAALRARVRVIASEVERAFAYVLETYPRTTLESLYLSGGGARMNLLAEGLRDALGIDVRRLDAPALLSASDHERRKRIDPGLYAASIGLALGGLVN